MTAKERREMQRLTNKVEELERQNAQYFDIYRDNLQELVGLRIALRNAHDALVDAVIEVNSVLRSDTTRVDRRLEVVDSI